MTPPIGIYGNPSLEPIYGQSDISSALWEIGPLLVFIAFGPYTLSMVTHGLRQYPATIGAFGQFSTSPTPRPMGFFPFSHHQFLCPNPFDYGVYGLNGLFGPFKPPMASMACGLWDPKPPFGLN
ncbi:hypothetical protein O181_070260 [Austropuccinia psidii MF-1]|uniref:Uncharacterized protein n=1 Tax=Austropuccinia psidii MF-1 TaxID=1389203 RepID=A0A9Q3I8W0_9BASI|nr:hypothetical protein [Austropuccinia psidii MF-1]